LRAKSNSLCLKASSHLNALGLDTHTFSEYMHIYFMGIGGTAMGSVAILLKEQGIQISGSDLNLYPPMSDRLRDAGIVAHEGYSAERLASLKPDFVVVGNVIGRGNPEAEWLLDTRDFPFVSLPQLIGERLIGKRHSIVITGTHGKTTTTALISHLLLQAGIDAGYLIAGVPNTGKPSSAMGNPKSPFVIEGDEYDCAFFDKRSKFIHYLPRTLIINNLEFDHGDIFRDIDDIQRSFSHLLRLVPARGNVLINGDDPKLVQWVSEEAHCSVWRVGFESQNDLQILDFSETSEGSNFRLKLEGQDWMNIHWKLAARYNARNAGMSILATALQTNPENPILFDNVSAINTFSGVRRRQQLLLDQPNLKLVEDFGHHPTAIGETLVSFRNRYPDHAVWAVFEPRSNTSRSPVFQNIWPVTLAHADEVWIGAIHRQHLLSADRKLNTQQLKTDLEDKGTPTQVFDNNEALKEALQEVILRNHKPLLILFFTNGSFDGVIQNSVNFAKSIY